MNSNSVFLRFHHPLQLAVGAFEIQRASKKAGFWQESGSSDSPERTVFREESRLASHRVSPPRLQESMFIRADAQHVPVESKNHGTGHVEVLRAAGVSLNSFRVGCSRRYSPTATGKAAGAQAGSAIHVGGLEAPHRHHQLDDVGAVLRNWPFRCRRVARLAQHVLVDVALWCRIRHRHRIQGDRPPWPVRAAGGGS